jgi:polar amino acid transport system substrate-binding protein
MGRARIVHFITALVFACACATAIGAEIAPQLGKQLAPTGRLRVGVYEGSPTSYVAGVTPRGVAYEMGQKLAKRAGIAFEPVVFPSNDKLYEAFRAGNIDLVFTNATEARRAFIDFTPTVLGIQKGYLVRPGSNVQDQAALDRAGVRIGVSRASTTQTELASIVKHATLVPMASLEEGEAALQDGRIEAYASNKAILFEMSDKVPHSRVLDGRWGSETFAFGIPKGRPAALEFVSKFATEERDAGGVRAAAERAGIRGTE